MNFEECELSIASIMYIPNYNILCTALEHYNNHLNDTQNLSFIQHKLPSLRNSQIVNNLIVLFSLSFLSFFHGKAGKYDKKGRRNKFG